LHLVGDLFELVLISVTLLPKKASGTESDGDTYAGIGGSKIHYLLHRAFYISHYQFGLLSHYRYRMTAVLTQARTRHRVQTGFVVCPVSCPTCIVAFAQGVNRPEL